MRFSLPVLLSFYLTVLPKASWASSSPQNLEEDIHSLSLQIVLGTAIIIAVVVIVTYIFKNLGERVKLVLFGLIVVPSLLTTTFLVGSTLYLNSVSETGGPVHWHADFEIYNCGEKIDLINPKGFSNKVGTATFHEHNDNRVHIEGVVLNKDDVNFGNFIKVIGGSLVADKMEIPTTKGMVVMESGQTCPDGTVGELQAFLYNIEEGKIIRHKLYDLPSYILSPYGNVPPGDCIIVEFAQNQSRSSYICDSYEVQILKGSIDYGD